MNANQRRKNRRKGVFTHRDKQQADRFCKLLYKLSLSDQLGLYSGWNEYTYTMSANYSNALRSHNKAIAVESLDVVLRSVTFEPEDWP